MKSDQPDCKKSPFVKVPCWVYRMAADSRIKPTSLVIYIALLEFADKDRKCWPSAATVMARAGVSKPTYHKGLAELKEHRAIVVEERRNRSNMFFLPKDPPEGKELLPSEEPEGKELSLGGKEPLPSSGQELLPSTGKDIDPRTRSTELDPKELDPIELGGPSAQVAIAGLPIPANGRPAAKRADVDMLFKEFWDIAWQKKAKGAARSAYIKAIHHTDPSRILAAWSIANDVWRGSWDRQYVPHPVRWLKEERWEDDPPEPRGAAVERRGMSQSDRFQQLAEQMRQDKQEAASVNSGWLGTLLVQEG